LFSFAKQSHYIQEKSSVQSAKGKFNQDQSRH